MANVDAAITLIKKWEGCKLTAYQDLCSIWTIGYGSTHGVYPGQHITQEQADAMLLADASDLATRIESILKVPVTDDQLCALISFAYNLGFMALFHSTLLARVNASEPADIVASEFLKWCNAGGKHIPGLLARREAEASLFQV